MFDAKIETIESGRIMKYAVTSNSAPLTFANAVKLWELDNEFRTYYSRLLADSPFLAFRWETPALTLVTAARPFEFVLLDSPHFCSRHPDSEAFADYFTDDKKDVGITTFDNLGGDSIMIVPSPRASETVYGHFADFIRGAPSSQIDALWQVIGRTVAPRLGTKPVWINTAGGGVAWLHVRLDSRPKYYGYEPYRKIV
jgi:hypothetical protein